ncbi:Mechanosensitive ion channel protein [Podosphaera aphanis]|nr:Mechanosensitive ion channel protein [Podosphaera aphanis]
MGSTPTPNESNIFPILTPELPYSKHRDAYDEETKQYKNAPNEYFPQTHDATEEFNSLRNMTRDDNDTVGKARQSSTSQRLDDDLEMLRVERVVSNARKSHERADHLDKFDINSTSSLEKSKLYQSKAYPPTTFAKFFKKLHQSSFLVRWIFYITPIALILLIPVLLGRLALKDVRVGDVTLFWFGVWLETMWLTLWVSRIVAKTFPWPIDLMSSLFTNNNKKWRDLGKALEIPATIFLWVIAIELSFLRILKNTHSDLHQAKRGWEKTVHKIIIAGLVGATLNLIEKMIIQLIAMSFHLRTYADRIEVNQFQILSLVKLYIFSRQKIAMADSEFELKQPSGGRTPMAAYVNLAGKNARHVFTKVGDVAGKIAGDFTGQDVKTSTHPQQVVIQLLHTTAGSQVLARRLYRTFARENCTTVLSEDLRPAFDTDEEAAATFAMFDMDLNGDLSMEELEAVCVEIGRERKGINASLKDLDSVVSKLDEVFFFVVVVITILVFLSLISTSASTMMTSAGSTFLALSWLLQATAQEFLQSIIFVFVKHPFDVGDRVTIYGNTGKSLTGDDYYVKEISLLYTEFKKMEGHIVQAPNSYLNTVFILNQRRSGSLAEAVPVTVKFGTTLEQIDALRQRLLEFVATEKRDYQKDILTEVTTIFEAYSITMNVIFFYKSNCQHELLRLQRRNKFICTLMVKMHELGFEGPRMRLAGAAEEFPMYLQGAYPESNEPQFRPSSSATEHAAPPAGPTRYPSSFLRKRANSSFRQRSETSTTGRHEDLPPGIFAIKPGANMGDVYEDREHFRVPSTVPIFPSAELTRSASKASGTSGKHRNRFFSRVKTRHPFADDGTSLDDIEAGAKKSGMPEISEIGLHKEKSGKEF